MTFRRTRNPALRFNQQAAIARAYAQKWRAAEPGELAEFVRRVNAFLALPDGSTVPMNFTTNQRRRTISMDVERREYEATVRKGVDVYAPIAVDDVERLRWRPF